MAALTRLEYSEVLEVPADMTDEELDYLVGQRYDAVNSGDYVDDVEYWERSNSCGFEDEDPTSDADHRVVRQHGKLAWVEDPQSAKSGE